MKDHEKRELVNELTAIAKQYGQAQQLRDRISHCVQVEMNRLEAENAAMRTRIAELQASVAWYSGRHEEDDKIIDALEIENAGMRKDAERFYHAARADALSEAAEEAPLNSDAECVMDMAEMEGK